jgi:predicted ATPase
LMPPPSTEARNTAANASAERGSFGIRGKVPRSPGAGKAEPNRCKMPKLITARKNVRQCARRSHRQLLPQRSSSSHLSVVRLLRFPESTRNDMLITSAQIKNYKGFHSTPELPFTRGFNVIIGQNDSGKTALIEALSLGFRDDPHKNLGTTSRTATSEVKIRFTFEPEEVRGILRTAGLVMLDISRDEVQATEARFRTLLLSEVNVECVIGSKGMKSSTLLEHTPPDGVNAVLLFQWDEATGEFERSSGGVGGGHRMTDILAQTARTRLYAFRAERLNIGMSDFGDEKTLQPDASNLPQVLNTLYSSNPSKFRKFNEHVTAIFPSIKQITVKPFGKRLQIMVWSIDPETERDDLAIPLSASGTGIGQVLAMLYVAQTAVDSQVILIDEPQSFLHPGATRKLVEILKEYSQHQFIISSHSPYAIADAEPETILLVRKIGMESTVQALNPRVAEDLRIVLSDVGARISDVFGAERILWVEGNTEELCFPKIIAKTSGVQLLGTVIIGVENTGDFETRRRVNAFDVYDRLSQQGALLPQAVAYVFDREGRSERDREDLVRRSKNKVRFLPRRMYENYLLHPRAIFEVISRLGTFPNHIEPSDVQTWIQTHRWDKEFFSHRPAEADRSDALWIEQCNGAKFLSSLFSHLSSSTVEYRKKEHGLMLTEWIVHNDPEHLQELTSMLVEVLQRPRQELPA